MLGSYIENKSSSTPFASLLFVVFTSILEVFLLCLSGYILASRGVLDKKTQKQLNRLNVSLFTPALLFSKVAFFLTPAKLRELWVIPIFFITVTTVSATLASALGWLFKVKHSQRNFAMAAAMFMNSNSLPIALMQSLVATVPDLKWDDDDDKDTMLGRALTYLVMYSTLGMMLRWSYGVRLLSKADPKTTETEVDEHTPLLGELGHDHYPEPPMTNSESSDTDGGESPQITIARASPPRSRPLPRRRTTFYNSFPNSPNRSRANLDPYSSTPDARDVEDVELPGINSGSDRSFATNVVRRLQRLWFAFNDFMTPPLWASVASLTVACIPPLQHWLQYHGQPIKGAISSAGKCSIPVTLIVLGAYFHPHPPEATDNTPDVPHMIATTRSTSTLVGTIRRYMGKPHQSEAPVSSAESSPRREGETKTVFIAVISRMILTPLALMPLIVLSARYDYHVVFEDPVFVVSNVLLLASPPALTLAQITQTASGDAFERLISRTIFWSYCIVTPPAMIVFVLVGLALTKI